MRSVPRWIRAPFSSTVFPRVRLSKHMFARIDQQESIGSVSTSDTASRSHALVVAISAGTQMTLRRERRLREHQERTPIADAENQQTRLRRASYDEITRRVQPGSRAGVGDGCTRTLLPATRAR
jgi:hypothetical protein